jgi:tetratricopeptide (TPR) repeat protein
MPRHRTTGYVITCSKTMGRWRNLAFFAFVLPGFLPAQTADDKLKLLLQQYKTALDNKNYVESVLACAATLRLAPANKDAQGCAAALKNPDQVNPVANAGKALLGAGEFEKALELCSAALVLNPMDTDAPGCASAARTKIVTHGQEQLKLEQVRGYVAAGDSAHAATPLGELLKSESPDILTPALQLQQTLNQRNVDQANAKQRANLSQAEFQIADGKRDAAATTLKDVLAAETSPEVKQEAVKLLERSRTSWPTVFRESLRATWIMQFLAALVMIAGTWLILHWVRNLWRWGDSHIARRWWRKSAKWTFTGVSEDTNLGARDPILDALRRVPNEVRKPVWTPTRLLLYPGSTGWEVWEDFAVDPAAKAKPVHEPVFQNFLQRQSDDKALADAFQNLQFTVGTVGVGNVTKVWTGLVDWWHAGEPSFSASARMIDSADAKTKLVVIRISASGGPDGMVSVLASTESQEGCDAVSLSAGRAAYKLLFRMGGEHTAVQIDAAQKKDTVEQIDAHAAFRQGATAAACFVRSVLDAQADRDRRDAILREAIENLAFVQHTFNRDPDHRVYYLEALRFQAVAYALMGREAAAVIVLEELEDATAGSARPRERQIELEAQYNQAILHWKRAVSANPPACPEFTMAGILWGRIAERGAELLHAERVWQLAQLAHTARREWPSINQREAQAVLDASRTLARDLEERAKLASGAERRQCLLLAQHAHRYYAIAQLRLIAAFHLPARGPFAPGASPVEEPIAALVEFSMECFARSGAIGPATLSTLVTRAYGRLLQLKWREAELLAKLAIAADPADQYARYIAAEAALQRHDEDMARQYLTEVQPARIEDAALIELAAHLVPVGLPPRGP